MNNFTVYVPPACITMQGCMPTFDTIIEMGQVMMTSWLHPQCSPPYTSMFSSNLICIYNFTVLLCYTLILVLLLTIRELNINFKVCIALLYISDAVTLIMSARESVITGCALNFRVDLNLVWQGTKTYIPMLGALIAVLLSIATFFLHLTGHITEIWFTPGFYQEMYIWPFQPLRIFLLLIAIFSAAILYICCAFMIVSTSICYLRREKFVLFTSLCVFITQIVFTYASFWMGAKLGIGDLPLNANLSYFGRPICCSVAAALQMLYLCSTSMRSNLKDQLGTLRNGIRRIVIVSKHPRKVSVDPVSASTIRTDFPRTNIQREQ
ncbi:unnamed protein product, partial [Mesorhabditis belari]|uniref:Uncharacterized protein n=1 Tax=Mesorhabditis belari TaxID=2138241 RepID=A0AAF3FL57_9BILA